MEKKVHISIVSPVYYAENIVEELVLQLKQAILNITEDFEIILINDCSPDRSWQNIIIECAKDTRVKGINLSRNFGQHYAITAGLNYAKGDWVVVMDCDLQDHPSEIPNLYLKAQEGWDTVFAQRVERSDKFMKRFLSKLFYMLFSYLTDTKQDPTVANFGIYNRHVINAILEMKDYIRYFPTMAKWVGFRQTTVKVEHSERFSGKTSYSFKKLLKLALDIILSFSDKPLRLTIKLGFSISLFAILSALYNLCKYIDGKIVVTGWTSLILSIWFLSGIIIFVLGIVGLYIGKTFEKVKNRPSFIIQETKNE